MTPLVAEAMAEMVHEDIELDVTSEEMLTKCHLIRQLYAIVDALCRRFGECHVEQKQDEYAVLRVIFYQECKAKSEAGDVRNEEGELNFSEVVDFVNTNECVKSSALSCHFLSARHNLTQGRTKNGMKPVVKIFRWSEKLQKIERTNPTEG